MIIGFRLPEGLAGPIEERVGFAGREALDGLGDPGEGRVRVNQEMMDAERRLGTQELEGKKSLIDEQVGTMRVELARLTGLLHDVERERREHVGQLTSQLREAGRHTEVLAETTQSLREALSSTSARGQWGERMAEDVLGVQEAAPAGEGIDLGSELGELFGAQSAVEEQPEESASTELGDAGLADIFKEFKKGVDKQLGKEDYDTRYNLGIAYKEMGLLDEAIAEFQLAAKDDARLLECASMLGICFLEKGMPKLAMKWFERGLKAPGRTEEEYAALRYDLATAHEAAGDVDKALALFTDLYGQDANFRDVAAKVRELRGAVG